MKHLFTIGEMSKLFGINIRTLRYYDSIGLLHPEYTDPDTGYRYYSSKQFESLNTIRYLRALDMPLEEIGSILQKRSVEHLLSTLEHQQEVVQKQIAALQQIDRKLRRRSDSIREHLASPCGILRETVFEPRKIALLRQEIPVGHDLEYPIRELERLYNMESVMFLGKVGLSVSKENLLREQYGSFSSIFVLIEEEDCYEGPEEQLPAGAYLTLRFRGTHEQSGIHYHRMLEYLREHDLIPCGDSVEISLIDSCFTDDTEKYVTELQIPYRRNE